MEGILSSGSVYGSLANTPGRLGILNGRIQMLKPQGYGAWPVVVPGENVEIFYKKQRVAGPTVIEDVRELEVITPSLPAASSFEVSVSPDKMQAILIVSFKQGKEYTLVDVDFTRKLIVRAKLGREIQPQPIDPVLVLKELRGRGVTGQVNYEQIMRACTGLVDTEVVIAEGVHPTPPVDGRVEFVCDLKTRPVMVDGDQRIDFRERTAIASVEPGDVLARWHPPTPGKPGKNVYGEEVWPRPPKRCQFKIGRGVRVMERGRLAVAAIGGRPVYRNGILSVNKQLIVEQDVDMDSGNIRFTGDIIVMGNVTESMKVDSGGIVEIKGNVYHARVCAGSHIRIAKKLIGGELSAGIMHPGLNRTADLLGRLAADLNTAAVAYAQLKGYQAERGINSSSDGYLMKCLLEKRFPQIAKSAERLSQFLATILTDRQLMEMEDHEELRERLNKAFQISHFFVGAGPLQLHSPAQLERAAATLLELRDRIAALVDSTAEIVVGYCQNARLEASGSITMRGPLAYNCDVAAGSDLVIEGECRSGNYFARHSISANIVGTGSMGKTRLAVGEGGCVRAAVFHPGVQLRIGPIRFEITVLQHNKEYRVHDGAWVCRTI